MSRISKLLFLLLYDNMLTTCFYVTLAYSWCFDAKISEPVQEPQSYELPVWKTIDFIAKYEAPNWPVLKAYLDRSGRYSIGYGTRSFEGEEITAIEAYNRFLVIVRSSIKTVARDFPDAPPEQIIALTSLYFNCGSGYNRVKNEGLEVYLEPWFCSPPWYGGLVKRRAAERALIAYSQE